MQYFGTIVLVLITTTAASAHNLTAQQVAAEAVLLENLIDHELNILFGGNIPQAGERLLLEHKKDNYVLALKIGVGLVVVASLAWFILFLKDLDERITQCERIQLPHPSQTHFTNQPGFWGDIAKAQEVQQGTMVHAWQDGYAALDSPLTTDNTATWEGRAGAGEKK